MAYVRFAVVPGDILTSDVEVMDVIREDFDSVHSDVDFLVEFEPDPGGNMFHAYMGLRGDLSRLLDRHVDLVMPSAVRNPYFAQEIAASGEHLYRT